MQIETDVHTDQPIEDALLTPEELAHYLKCGRTYAYRLLRLGEIPSLKLGKLRRVRRRDADIFVEQKINSRHDA